MKEKIPYHKPLQFSTLETEVLITKIKEVLKSGMLTNDKYVGELEDKIKEMYGVGHVIATSNCTMGLLLSFQYEASLYNIIHMPNFTWISPYLTLPNNKKLYDIDKETWLMKDWPTERNEYVFPTHTFGNIIELDREYHVIYDGAHALGSRIKKLGDATVLSLAPTKLVTSCEGGLVLTNQKHLADFVRFRRDRCARMSEIHALIGLATLEHLDMILAWKEEVHHNYKSYNCLIIS